MIDISCDQPNTEMIISINVLRFLDRLIVLHFSNYNERTQISNSLFRDTTFTTN